ncbi:39733_t:CDS:2, partial [Gigaspora margarita]
KQKIGTLTGIANWSEWKWPTEGSDKGSICARALSNFGTWNIFSPTEDELQNNENKNLSTNIFHRLGLKENQKSSRDEMSKKLNAQEIQQELLYYVKQGEIEESEIPKVSTIQNWIHTFTCSFKSSLSQKIL